MKSAEHELEQVFAIRFWPVRSAGAPPHWRGYIDHLPSGERQFIATAGEIGAFVDRYLSDVSDAAARGDNNDSSSRSSGTPKERG